MADNDKLEPYWQRLNFFCRMGTLDDWELHFEAALYIYRLFAEMQAIIYPNCQRRGRIHFNATECRECRQAGNDTETCRMIHQREIILRDYLLEIS